MSRSETADAARGAATKSGGWRRPRRLSRYSGQWSGRGGLFARNFQRPDDLQLRPPTTSAAFYTAPRFVLLLAHFQVHRGRRPDVNRLAYHRGAAARVASTGLQGGTTPSGPGDHEESGGPRVSYDRQSPLAPVGTTSRVASHPTRRSSPSVCLLADRSQGSWRREAAQADPRLHEGVEGGGVESSGASPSRPSPQSCTGMRYFHAGGPEPCIDWPRSVRRP